MDCDLSVRSTVNESEKSGSFSGLVRSGWPRNGLTPCSRGQIEKGTSEAALSLLGEDDDTWGLVFASLPQENLGMASLCCVRGPIGATRTAASSGQAAHSHLVPLHPLTSIQQSRCRPAVLGSSPTGTGRAGRPTTESRPCRYLPHGYRAVKPLSRRCVQEVQKVLPVSRARPSPQAKMSLFLARKGTVCEGGGRVL